MKLLLALLPPASPFLLPSYLPPGVYTVPIAQNGTALSPPTLLSALPVSPPSESESFLSRRQAPPLPSPSTNCHGRALNLADYDAALRSFNAICDRGEYYAAYTSVVVSAGSTFAYLCNYERDNRCWSSEMNEANGLMNGRCGGNAGWVYVDGYKKSYGREVGGVDIC